MKFFVLFLALSLCISGEAFEGAAITESPTSEESVLEMAKPYDLAFACQCVSFGGNYFTEKACNALPITQCGRVGNIVCYPSCR